MIRKSLQISPWTVRSGASLLLLSALALTACGGETRSAAPGPMLLLAIDGLEPALVDRFVAEGRMPTMKRLIAGGSRALIASEGQILSPIIWTSVATGVSKERHGILNWTIDGVPITSAMRKEPAFWNLLARHGVRTAVAGWIATWPAEAEAGIVVSDRAEAGKDEKLVAPDNVLDLASLADPAPEREIVARFTDWPYEPEFRARAKSDPLYAPNFLIEQRLLKIYQRDSFYLRASEQLLDRGDLDLLAVYLRGLDYVGHGFWQYFESDLFVEAGKSVDLEHARLLKGVIPAYYSWLDRRVGELIRRAGPEASVMIVSDHGFGPSLPPNEMIALKADFLTGSHRRRGEFIVSGPAFRRGEPAYQVLRHLDVAPTLFYLFDIPISRALEGGVQLRYLSDTALGHRPRFVDSYAPRPAGSAPTGKTDEETLRDLESLGYLQ